MTPPPEAATRTRDRLLLAGLGLAVVLLRIAALSAFPEIEADEGLWTNSSKNFVAFGDWFLDSRTHLFLSPLYHALSAVVFGIAGPGIAAARAISALAGVLSTWLVYVLVLRVTDRRAVALVAAALLGFDELAVLLSRRALIESLQLCVALGSAVLLTHRGWRWAAGAGAVFGLALLAKVNGGFLAAVFAAVLLARSVRDEGRFTPRTLLDAGAFAAGSLLVAGAGYGLLYGLYPDRFVSAFRFELDGEHFTRSAHALLRVGRFGLDPALAARTVIELFRESPFLMVLASCGAAVAAVSRPKGSGFFGLWLVVGAAFFLGQTFQPLRYFYLVWPALAFFGAVTLDALSRPEASGGLFGGRLPGAVLAIAVVFNVAYIGANAVTNRATMLHTVTSWAAGNLRSSDRVLAAGYFCTDLPVRAYAHYQLARNPEQLVETIDRLRIDYVIYDAAEWHRELGETLAARYPVVARWSFGAVYRVRPEP